MEGHFKIMSTAPFKSVSPDLSPAFLRKHDFFRAENTEAMALRVAVADQALQDTLRWVQEGGDVAIFDATNTTRERRQMVYDTIVLKHGFKCLFLGIHIFFDN